MSANLFENLSPAMQESLQKMQISEPSEVQKACIPEALNHSNLLVRASTGSGKTLAFLIPAIEQLESQETNKHFPHVLILSPTRELSWQTASIARKLLSGREGIRTALLTGGVDMNKQVRAFHNGADLVAGTPARVLDHLRRHTFKPKQCTILILDEADEMLSMGFEEQVRAVAEQLPLEQIMLFSATYNEQVLALADSLLKDPVRIEIENHDQLEQKIREECILVPEQQKIDVLKKILKKHSGQAIIFCNKRVTVDFITQLLQQNGYTAVSVHSDTDPAQRRRQMNIYRHGESQLLVATDAVGRGIDIPESSLVISYDMPDSTDTLVHRFGRTARAGTSGSAYVLLKPHEKYSPEDLKKLFPDIICSAWKTSARADGSSVRLKRRQHHPHSSQNPGKFRGNRK